MENKLNQIIATEDQVNSEAKRIDCAKEFQSNKNTITTLKADLEKGIQVKSYKLEEDQQGKLFFAVTLKIEGANIISFKTPVTKELIAQCVKNDLSIIESDIEKQIDEL
ncbi:hypothetical protein [Flammeovirga sp. OC4]|uniref:hypothetical protein n=1 Tax=Flammeovirga sp. OC4 TaxID=1382345 RepID=UPI0005C6EB7B|nr:hypothetical protein [Flammeovirga sp. OC4]